MDRCAQIRFDGWVLHPGSGELTHGVSTTRLQDKPLRILIELLAHPGELVTRERLIECLWPRGVVEFDMALNAAMRRLRVALRDEAETPRYIETVPRKGYRFIGTLDSSPSITALGAAVPPATRNAVTPLAKRIRMYVIGGFTALALTGLTMISTRDSVLPVADKSLPAGVQARELYVRARELLADLTPSGTDKAIAAFGRVTTLEPAFAGGYSGFGMAMTQAAYDGSPDGAALINQATQAFDRALQLDPELGEAWIGKALCTKDPATAEEDFRRGLRLAPQDAVGYLHFADFLFFHARRGEAFEAIDRAQRLNPRSARVLSAKASQVLIQQNDLAESMRLLRAALSSNPDYFPALIALADQSWFFTGDFADSIHFAERALALEPESDDVRNMLANFYLDVDDPDTAAALLPDSPKTIDARTALAQYRGDVHRAAEIAASAADNPYIWIHHSLSPLAEAIRDSEVSRSDPTAAVRLLESVKAQWPRFPTGQRAFSAIYAHALQLAGDQRRARETAESLLRLLEAEATGRPPFWFGRERATAFMVLGQDELALVELAGNQRLNQFARWWYTGERDPLYARLHSDARFRELVAAAANHRREQRAILETWRSRGEVPLHRR
jgi:DNA-binding winged helix-turn-helix (wHTH) protein/Tfp pilus assembly protein PilF